MFMNLIPGRKGLFLNPNTPDKKSMLEFFAKNAFDLGLITSEQEMLDNIYKKEADKGTVELREGVILPHGRGEFVKKSFVMMAIYATGLDYPDAKKHKVHVVIFIGVPKDSPDQLKILTSIARIFSIENFYKNLLKAEVLDDIWFLLKKYDLKTRQESIDDAKEKYLTILSLNESIDQKKILMMSSEAGIRYVSQINAKRLVDFGFFMPYIASIVNSSYSEVFIGITNEKDSANILYALLKEANYNLEEANKGFLVQIPATEIYGGVIEDLDF